MGKKLIFVKVVYDYTMYLAIFHSNYFKKTCTIALFKVMPN